MQKLDFTDKFLNEWGICNSDEEWSGVKMMKNYIKLELRSKIEMQLNDTIRF